MSSTLSHAREQGDFRKEIGMYSLGTLIPVNIFGSVSGYQPYVALERAGVQFHDFAPDSRQLQIVTLPTGWGIVSTGEIKFRPGSSMICTNLLDEKKRVRAVMRQRKRFAWISGRTTAHMSAEMIVACPIIISFRGVKQENPVVRARQRYGKEFASISDTRLLGESREDFKWRMTTAMYDKLDERYPGWRVSPEYWDTLL